MQENCSAFVDNDGLGTLMSLLQRSNSQLDDAQLKQQILAILLLLLGSLPPVRVLTFLPSGSFKAIRKFTQVFKDPDNENEVELQLASSAYQILVTLSDFCSKSKEQSQMFSLQRAGVIFAFSRCLFLLIERVDRKATEEMREILSRTRSSN
jgi:hypothetical protein